MSSLCVRFDAGSSITFANNDDISSGSFESLSFLSRDAPPSICFACPFKILYSPSISFMLKPNLFKPVLNFKWNGCDLDFLIKAFKILKE